MTAIKKEDAQRHLDIWMEAEAAVATGQSYQIGSRSLTRANLKEIRDTIEFWAGQVTAASARRNPVYHFVPRDC